MTKNPLKMQEQHTSWLSAGPELGTATREQCAPSSLKPVVSFGCADDKDTLHCAQTTLDVWIISKTAFQLVLTATCRSQCNYIQQCSLYNRCTHCNLDNCLQWLHYKMAVQCYFGHHPKKSSNSGTEHGRAWMLPVRLQQNEHSATVLEPTGRHVWTSHNDIVLLTSGQRKGLDHGIEFLPDCHSNRCETFSLLVHDQHFLMKTCKNDITLLIYTPA